MTIKTSTLRPGYLVSLKTSVRGNVKYSKVNLESQTTEDGVAVAKWETGATPDESGRVRGKAISSELRPLVQRWIETGEPPSAEELAGLRSRRSGGKGKRRVQGREG
jgi:hypothetical protein